jgi:hypothetical protein
MSPFPILGVKLPIQPRLETTQQYGRNQRANHRNAAYNDADMEYLFRCHEAALLLSVGILYSSQM